MEVLKLLFDNFEIVVDVHYGRPGLVVTRVSCNRGLADKTANAN